MPLSNPLFFAINVAVITLLSFNASLLIAKSKQNSGYFALAISFMAIVIVTCQPSLKQLMPTLQLPILILSLPALLLIAPCFWLYVKGLTSKTKWQFKQSDAYHFMLPLIGGIIAVLAFVIPSDIQHALLVVGDETLLQSKPLWLRYSVYAGLIATFALVMGWIAQSAYYLVKTAKHLVVYRAHLKDIFSTTEQKELRWLGAMVALIGVPWCVIAANLFFDNVLFPSAALANVSNVSLLVFTLFICFWGQRQSPGFEEVYKQREPLESEDGSCAQNEKYKTSALDNKLATAIADKITQALAQDKLFLDANLSLPKLAKHIATSPNYISQTLSEQLESNFFDYVNRYRVMYAKAQLIESGDTVIDIAMSAGFNSKSAFYAAFKKHVGKTPREYRLARS